MEYDSTITSKRYEIELKQVDLPFDVITGRKSIIKHSLLRYDKDPVH